MPGATATWFVPVRRLKATVKNNNAKYYTNNDPEGCLLQVAF